jgi:hypothetical protein
MSHVNLKRICIHHLLDFCILQMFFILQILQILAKSNRLIVLFCSSTFLYDFCLVVLSIIEYGVLKSQTIVIDCLFYVF